MYVKIHIASDIKFPLKLIELTQNQNGSTQCRGGLRMDFHEVWHSKRAQNAVEREQFGSYRSHINRAYMTFK